MLACVGGVPPPPPRRVCPLVGGIWAGARRYTHTPAAKIRDYAFQKTPVKKMPDIQADEIRAGDIVKFRNHRGWIAAVEGVWLVINVGADALFKEGQGRYAKLKKGSNTRYTHASHLEKV